MYDQNGETSWFDKVLDLPRLDVEEVRTWFEDLINNSFLDGPS